MKNSAKAIFLDIDETLVTNETGPFPDDVEQIEEAHRRGHKIFLSTGRGLAHIPGILKDAPWLDGIIAGAGALVIIGDHAVYHKWIPQELLPAICALYFQLDKFCVFEGTNGVYGIKLPEHYNTDKKIFSVTKEDDFLTKYSDAIISKLTIQGDISEKERDFLSEYFQLNTFPPVYFEGILLGESKSKGMSIVLETLGIPRANSIAIGDSRNDIDIICAAGLGIAMGNACEELKAVAGEITGDCGKGGVGQAIKKFVLDQ
ncbi:HAD family hydrolase [Treponema primitia]|uniref:HAD family hydrolase n=1 Tax=Treponema primitia TaxID=88058 RepID=UPI00025555B8|nr:HAD family hydrolase [Treponema primitia]